MVGSVQCGGVHKETTTGAQGNHDRGHKEGASRSNRVLR